jgi:hypothetical protein
MVDIRLIGCGMVQIWHPCLPIMSSYAICRPQPSSQSLGEIYVVPFVCPSLLQMALGSYRRPSSILARRAWTHKSLRVKVPDLFLKMMASIVCIL